LLEIPTRYKRVDKYFFAKYECCKLILRLHDQVGSTSCYMIAGRASLMFARSCKRGITFFACPEP